MKAFSLGAIALACLLGMSSCAEQKAEPQVPLYGWEGEGQNITEQSVDADFKNWKSHGLKGILYNVGFDVEKHTWLSRIAHENGLEYHAWIPTMLNHGADADSTWYAVNRLGQSAYSVQAYVPYYKVMCPNNENVVNYLVEQYSKIADIKDVDYIHLDYIRYVDVKLARGLWEKYNLTFEEEYAPADYCYCDKCVADFKAATGIDIKSFEDPSTCKEWAEWRCDVITNVVGKIADAVHAKGKKISAAVFPGPDSHAVGMVRQQWNEWKLDAVFPMNYNDFYLEPASWVGEITKEEVESVNGKFPVYSGLFISHDWRNKANIKDPEGHGLIPSEIVEAAKGSMEAGAAGIALFTPSRMTPEHWAELDKYVFGK